MNSSTPKMVESFLDFSAEEEDHPFRSCYHDVKDIFGDEDFPNLVWAPEAEEPIDQLFVHNNDTFTADQGYRASLDLQQRSPSSKENQKRKGKDRANDDVENQDFDELEVHEMKKQIHGSPSTKRSRTAEAHNFSERQRRGRINEKMKTLQELIPHCNKTDKASLLDDAIMYLKSLQQMVQTMSMGYGMVPMMYPGLQQFIPPMTTGIGIEIAANGASSEHLIPRFPVPIAPATSQPDPMLKLHRLQVPIQPQMSNFHLYQPYLASNPTQSALSQNQEVKQQSHSKPRNIVGVQNHDDTHYIG